MADIGSIQVIVTLTNGVAKTYPVSGEAVESMRNLLARFDARVDTRMVATAVEMSMVACDPVKRDAERRRREGE